MAKPIVLDRFDAGVHCVNCNRVTLHKMQQIDEQGDSQYIGYYGECDICENVSDFNEEDFLENEKE